MEKKKRRNKCDLGDDFIAPDGGWGWIVCIAAGLSNLVILQLLQSFGLLFHDRLLQIGLTSSQITTIANTQQSISSFTGLLNGPMFRRFSYRQVALGAAAIASIGIFLSSIANTFITFLLTFSIMFGFGMGTSLSSTSLALNTYFKERRRRSNSYAWTISAIGPIIMPPIITILLVHYGFQGTVMLFSGLALHAIACALIYQPVQWHVKKIQIEDELLSPNICEHCKTIENKNRRNSTVSDCCEILETNTPMLTQANDGWFGSKLSLHSKRRLSCAVSIDIDKDRKFSLVSFNKNNTTKSPALKIDSKCTCTENQNLPPNEVSNDNQVDETFEKELKWFQKIGIFFDLNLLKDFTYVNLMFGLTLSTFVEVNFSMLTPFFLSDFGFTKPEIAFAMSSLGCSDIIIRFLIPFITDKIKWDNRIFYSIGLIIMVIARIFVTQSPSYQILLVLFILIGIGKAIRTVFMGLVIPSHVPLKRLPAAAGLQLVSAGIFTLIAGPIVGIIRDKTDYGFVINFLNIMSMLTAISWTIELIYQKKQKRNETETT